MNTEKLNWDFDYHAPSKEKVYLHETVRNKLHRVAIELDELIPDDCREKSLAITKLEEVMFWANAALARNPRPDEAK